MMMKYVWGSKRQNYNRVPVVVFL